MTSSGRFVRGTATALLSLALAVLVVLAGRAPAAQAPTAAPAPASALAGPEWIRVQYGRLLDDSTVVRTGQPLTAAVRDPELRGTVQPFVDLYSSLLQHAVQMLHGPDPLPHTSVTEYYPPGAPQPAWVAIFRGGRVHAAADGKDHVRLFLEGADPQGAYDQHYSVVRHCLNALAPRDGTPLRVEVYAYQHDYAASELRLNTRCLQLSAAGFPSRKKELDLAGLADFFHRGAMLEGAQLSRTEGLVLYGKPGKRLTLSGQPLSLGDLAVAYRAVFHAGDNQAFVSLDEHPDPTRAMVNFGGFLQDTRIGSVVLEADKRLKTITGGLDPNTFQDLRQTIRSRVPSYLSASERDLAAGGWIAARLWLYPDQAGVETDPNHEFAAIVHPRFTADAERSRKQFISGDGAAPAGTAISPGTRGSIDDLNTHYDEYAQVFSELDELSAVARLMALASWLKQANPDWLDLDALLAVDLLPCTTERERENLVAATVLTCPLQQAVDAAYVAAHAKLLHLAPILGRSIREYFGTRDRLAGFLAGLPSVAGQKGGSGTDHATDILARQGGEPVRSLIRSRRDLRALAEYEIGASGAGASTSGSALAAQIAGAEKELDRLETEIAAVKGELAAATGPRYNQLVDRHNALVKEHAAATARHRQLVLEYNGGQVRTTAVMEIAGGVDLDPRSFQILTTTQSERLAEMQALAQSIASGEAVRARATEWLRSQAAKIPGAPPIESLPATDWQVTVEQTAENAALAYARSLAGDSAWASLVNTDGSWRAGLQQAAAQYYDESEFDPAAGRFNLRRMVAGKLVEHLIGGVPAAGLLVFERAKVGEVLAPLEKPFRWLKKVF